MKPAEPIPEQHVVDGVRQPSQRHPDSFFNTREEVLEAVPARKVRDLFVIEQVDIVVQIYDAIVTATQKAATRSCDKQERQCC